VMDALGGSNFLEKLTLDMEQGALRYFEKLDAMGGMVKAIEAGYPQKEIAEASYAYQRAVEAGEKIIVGVNRYAIDEPPPRTLYIDEGVRESQTAKLRKLRAERSGAAVERALDALRRAAEAQPEAAGSGVAAANTMPFILDCVRAYATLGEICEALHQVFGGWEEA
jgi:methylmalonyl-CoA mutase, N-terminal domain